MATTSAHRFPASQPAVLLRRLRSHDMMLPMIPGSAAAALPASWASIRPRACKCFFAHSLRPALSAGGVGVGITGATAALPPVRASTMVEIASPIAVKIDTIVTPCSRNRVLTRSDRVVFLSKTWSMESRIWLTCDLVSLLRALMLSLVAMRLSAAFCISRSIWSACSVVPGCLRSLRYLLINCWKRDLFALLHGFHAPRSCFQAIAKSLNLAKGQ